MSPGSHLQVRLSRLTWKFNRREHCVLGGFLIAGQAFELDRYLLAIGSALPNDLKVSATRWVHR
jgi:hypothetical protein